MAAEDEKFESAIQHLIELGLPEKHGLTVAAYRKKCRRAWDACVTDKKYPDKLLMDHLWQRHALHGFGEGGYLDEATWHSLQPSDKSRKKISCVAVGRIPMGKEGPSDFPAHKPPSYYLFGNDLWIVALFDVLGFEAAYNRLGIGELYRLYDQLIQKVVQNKSVPSFSTTERVKGGVLVSYFHLWIGAHYFSDTILLWCPATVENFSPFLTRCSDLFIEALGVGLPLRGAVSLGEANFSKRKQVFLGEPLIDCARLESSQNWLGVSLTRACVDVLEHIDSDLVLPYTPPVKAMPSAVASAPLHAGLVLDWPRRARSTSTSDIGARLDSLNSSKEHSFYYDNASGLVRYSAENASWNKSEGMLLVFPALRNAIITSRKEGSSLPAWALSMINTLESNTPDGAVIGEALRRAAYEGINATDLQKLPTGPRGFLTEIESVIAGRAIDLHRLAIAVVEARFGIYELAGYDRQILDNPESSKSIKRSLEYLRSVLKDEAIPDIPEGITEPEADVLRMVDTFVRGKSLPVDVEMFLPAIMSAANSGEPLQEKDRNRLRFIESKGEPWSYLATAIRAVLANRPILLPRDLFLPQEVASTIKVLEGYMAQRRNEYQATDKALARIEGNISFETLKTLIELLNKERDDPSPKLKSILHTMSVSGYPHDAVARFIGNLLVDRRSPVPGGVTKVVACFMSVLSSGYRSEPITIPVAVIGEMISNARARRGGDCYGLALFGILFAQDHDGPLLRTFCEALVMSRALPPIPDGASESTRDQMAALLHIIEQEDTWFGLGQMADVITDEVLNGVSLDQELIAAIAAVGQGEEPFAPFGKWLYQLVMTAEDEPPPSGLPNHIADRIDVWRLACIPRCSVDAIMSLRAAVLKKRLDGEEFAENDMRVLRSLRRAGGSFSHLAAFARKLSRPHAMPSVPMGLPPGILSAFASARREALSREGAGLIAIRPSRLSKCKS